MSSEKFQHELKLKNMAQTRLVLKRYDEDPRYYLHHVAKTGTYATRGCPEVSAYHGRYGDGVRVICQPLGEKTGSLYSDVYYYIEKK